MFFCEKKDDERLLFFLASVLNLHVNETPNRMTFFQAMKSNELLYLSTYPHLESYKLASVWEMSKEIKNSNILFKNMKGLKNI